MAAEPELDEIEREFSASWDRMEVFYTRHFTSPDWEWLKPIHNLIPELRGYGYDKKLRAGQSLWMFVLSRSREHGLRDGQSSLVFDLHREGGMSVSYFEAPAVRFQIEVDSVKLTPEVEDLLARLLAHPIIG